MKDIKPIIDSFRRANGLDFSFVSDDVFSGYKTAYGTYDVTINKLFVNVNLLENAPVYKVLFYLYHEMRHALQYAHPEQLDKEIRESLPYVLLYNSICFRLLDNAWVECKLDGDEDYFTQAYLSFPYELDANSFAHSMVKATLSESKELNDLYTSWLPNNKIPFHKLAELFKTIDKQIKI